jgi:hypothetical protein
VLTCLLAMALRSLTYQGERGSENLTGIVFRLETFCLRTLGCLRLPHPARDEWSLRPRSLHSPLLHYFDSCGRAPERKLTASSQPASRPMPEMPGFGKLSRRLGQAGASYR